MFYGNFITQQEYQNSMNQLRETYGNDFDVDILLLSRRAGDNRDAAYAYNIMSRLPPGSSKEYYEAAGIDPRTAEKFYDSGGRIESMPESERARFLLPSMTSAQCYASHQMPRGRSGRWRSKPTRHELPDKTTVW